MDLRRGHGARSTRSARTARRPLRREQGRPGRHRHAQLPRVGHRASPPSPRSAPSSVSLNAWWTEDELDYALEDCGATRAHRRLRAGRARRGRVPAARRPDPRRARAGDLAPTASTAGRTCVVPGAPMPDVDDRPRRRRHDPLHVRHHRAARRARCPPTAPSCRRCIGVRLPGGARPAAPSPTDGEPTGRPAGVHPHRAAVPRHRLRARDAVVLRQRPEARDHVQVGPRAGARADRARAGHQLRRRADAELGPARVARLRATSTRRASSASAAAARPRRPSSCKRVDGSFAKRPAAASATA